jgi:penicillin-binding protein 1A
VAVPIFRAFITEAIKDKPAVPFRVPPGLRMVRVNPETGALAEAGDKIDIWESYIPGTEPQEGQIRPILDGSVTGAAAEGAAAVFGTPPQNDNIIPSPSVYAPQPASSPPAAAFQAPPVVHTEPPPPPSSATQGTGGLY